MLLTTLDYKSNGNEWSLPNTHKINNDNNEMERAREQKIM